jgi:hypothetical protein
LNPSFKTIIIGLEGGRSVGKSEFYIAYLWLTYNLMDLIFTHWGLEGGHVECNPLGYALIAGSNEGWLYALKATVALLLIPLIARIGKRYPSAWTYLRMWNLVLCGVVLWNLALVVG